jgi:6,7-dimethyl-8-ribityllumazine synthase
LCDKLFKIYIKTGMKKILIIEARFYDKLADMLADAAVAALVAEGYEYERLAVPGVFEIPAAVSMAVSSDQYAGYIALGCVIRGETTHYDYVCAEGARGLNDIAINHQAAIGFGIITAENQAQAEARADKNRKDMGGKAARACIQMIKIKQLMHI